MVDTAAWIDHAGIADIVAPGSFGFADIAEVVDIVGLVRIEVVGNAGAAVAAVDTADTAVATEWQPFLQLLFCVLLLQPAEYGDQASDQEEICRNKKPGSRELDFCMKKLILWWDPN